MADVPGEAEGHRRRGHDESEDHRPSHDKCHPPGSARRVLVLTRRAQKHRAELGVAEPVSRLRTAAKGTASQTAGPARAVAAPSKT